MARRDARHRLATTSAPCTTSGSSSSSARRRSAARSPTTTRRASRPRVSDEAWASAAPIVKQAAVGAALQTVDDYARASAAAGGFDRGEAHLSRTNLRLDAKGWEAAAKACEKLLGELDRIEEAAEKRIAKDPHAEGASDAALVMLLFEAVKLQRGRRRRAGEAEAQGAAPPVARGSASADAVS